MIRKEVKELAEKINQHLNHEMKLIDRMIDLNLSEEESDYLIKLNFSHPHTKRSEKELNFKARDVLNFMLKNVSLK